MKKAGQKRKSNATEVENPRLPKEKKADEEEEKVEEKESLVQEIFRLQVECMVCRVVMKDPRELVCRHTLCFSCCSLIHKAGKIECPLCRTVTKQLLNKLPVDRKVSGFLESYQNALRQLPTSSKAVPTVPGQCGIPGCKKLATNKAIGTQLSVCVEHHEAEVEKVMKRFNSATSSVESLTRATGVLAMRRDDINSELNKTETFLKDVADTERLLKAIIDEKVENLQKKLRDHRKMLTSLKEAEENAGEDLKTRESEVSAAMVKKEYSAVSDKLFQLDFVLKSLQKPIPSLGNPAPSREDLTAIFKTIVDDWTVKVHAGIDVDAFEASNVGLEVEQDGQQQPVPKKRQI